MLPGHVLLGRMNISFNGAHFCSQLSQSSASKAKGEGGRYYVISPTGAKFTIRADVDSGASPDSVFTCLGTLVLSPQAAGLVQLR